MRKRIGYFEGTDPGLLTALVCLGHDTLPVSNSYDSHGRPYRLINDQNRYDLLIGYLHKIYAVAGFAPDDPRYQDVFHLCRTYDIPLLLEVPAELHDQARDLLEDIPEIVRFVDPGDALTVAKELLEEG